MKADVTQQRSLLELAELDAELSRAEHRAANLPEQQTYEQVQADHRAAQTRVRAAETVLADARRAPQAIERDLSSAREALERFRAGQPPAAGMDDMVKTLRVLNAARESAQTGQPVRIGGH